MYIAKEGQKAYAWHDDLGKLVVVEYQYRTIHLDVEDVVVHTLVGVHVETDKVLMIPHYPSVADIGKAVREKEAKEKMEASPVLGALKDVPEEEWEFFKKTIHKNRQNE